MKIWCLIALAAPLAAQDVSRDLMRSAIANYEKSLARAGDLLFERRVESRQLEASGAVRQMQTFLVRRELIEDLPVSRLIERDGRPLPAEEIAKQQANIRKAIDEYRKQTPEEQKKRLNNSAGIGGREMEFLREMPDALDYKYLDSVWEEGREVMRFEMSPRTGYKPKHLQARVFEKVRGEIRVDKAAAEIRLVDAEVFDTVNVGGFLAKIEKGTRFLIERKAFAGDHWVPERIRIKFGTKIMMVKSIRQETESRFTGYRVWRAASGG
ncbi:MAG: hypothetical protein SFV18_13730 [Bryobacteraceae bacterium]|nr:hypothetical protein [Bryobacteraceae bacterium]